MVMACSQTPVGAGAGHLHERLEPARLAAQAGVVVRQRVERAQVYCLACASVNPTLVVALIPQNAHLRFVDFFPPDVLRATAARMSALNAFASISSPS